MNRFFSGEISSAHKQNFINSSSFVFRCKSLQIHTHARYSAFLSAISVLLMHLIHNKRQLIPSIHLIISSLRYNNNYFDFLISFRFILFGFSLSCHCVPFFLFFFHLHSSKCAHTHSNNTYSLCFSIQNSSNVGRLYFAVEANLIHKKMLLFTS